MGRGLGQTGVTKSNHQKKYRGINKTAEIQRISAVLVRPEGFEPPAFWSVACLRNGDDFFQPCLALFVRLVMSLTSHPLRLFRRKIFCSGSDYGSTDTEPVRLCTPLFHRHLPAREQLGEMRKRNPVPVRVYRKGIRRRTSPTRTWSAQLVGL